MSIHKVLMWNSNMGKSMDKQTKRHYYNISDTQRSQITTKNPSLLFPTWYSHTQGTQFSLNLKCLPSSSLSMSSSRHLTHYIYSVPKQSSCLTYSTWDKSSPATDQCLHLLVNVDVNHNPTNPSKEGHALMACHFWSAQRRLLINLDALKRMS